MEVEVKCKENNLKDKNVISDMFPSSLLESLDNIIKKEGYVTYRVDKRKISTDGGNYLGVLYEVDIKGKTADGEKETNIFIKSIIPGECLEFLSVTEVYLRELYAYTELFKIYRQIQKEAGVPIEERFKTVRCFDSNPEAIFLENMAKKGFTTGEKMETMSLTFTELAVQQLAKYHGLSFVLQKQNPDYYNSKLKVMKPAFRINDDSWKNFVWHMCKTSLKGISDHQKENLMKLIPTILGKYNIFFKETTFGCICHCDYRQNNILMKKTNGKTTEVIPVDYQLIHYGCPLNDFFYFIFTGTDREFRRNHLTHLKNMYYNTLERFLRYFDMDVEHVFPRKEFERLYKERLYYGLIIGMLCTPFHFVIGDIPDLGKDDMTTVNFNLHNSFKERIQGIIDDFIEWGYL